MKMNMNMNIFIRKETINEEYRTPIIPSDVAILRENGYKVIVERSKNRCYSDVEYEKHGATLVNHSWESYSANTNTLILGIKKIENMDILNNHNHVYFSHSFKGQSDSKTILKKFKESGSIIYDLEYFKHSDGSRVIYFGFYAGIIGAGLGLVQYFKEEDKDEDIQNLECFDSVEDFYSFVERNICFGEMENIKIALVGPNGNCGKGVQEILKYFGFNFSSFERKDCKDSLNTFDIIINCINLKENVGSWFDNSTVFSGKTVIIDISCDYNNVFNPIKLYNKATTFENPVYKYNNNVSIISIENLPSLIPKVTSEYFSSKLVPLLINYSTEYYNKMWKNSYLLYEEVIETLDEGECNV